MCIGKGDRIDEGGRIAQPLDDGRSKRQVAVGVHGRSTTHSQADRPSACLLPMDARRKFTVVIMEHLLEIKQKRDDEERLLQLQLIDDDDDVQPAGGEGRSRPHSKAQSHPRTAA